MQCSPGISGGAPVAGVQCSPGHSGGTPPLPGARGGNLSGGGAGEMLGRVGVQGSFTAQPGFNGPLGGLPGELPAPAGSLQGFAQSSGQGSGFAPGGFSPSGSGYGLQGGGPVGAPLQGMMGSMGSTGAPGFKNLGVHGQALLRGGSMEAAVAAGGGGGAGVQDMGSMQGLGGGLGGGDLLDVGILGGVEVEMADGGMDES